MRRITLILAAALVMVALIAISAGTALAANPAACNAGTELAHNTVPEGLTAHEYIPEC